MNQERLYRTDALILRRADFGETDRLLTIFTPGRGKLRVLAKGARKTTSRKAGHIELFMLTDMLLSRGRTWDIISQVELIEPYRALREDLQQTGHAYYIAELIDRFTEENDANQPLFALLALTLARLGQPEQSFLALRYFELHLLGLAGYQPQLYYCLTCDKALEPVDCYFHVADGGTLCPEHGRLRPQADPLPLAVLKVLRYLQAETWEKVAKLQLTPATQDQVESLLLRTITFILERQLKSIDFLKRLRREA
jgi:DNA repair protein RecO (recombination protein O)